MNFPKIAEQVIEKLGGKNNIATAAHCATRLRIVLNDESKVDKEGIEAIEGVKGQFSVAGQYQIIFGSGTVNKVHEQLTKQLGIGDVSKAEVAEAALGQQNLLQRIVKGLADIFVPIIPAIVAGGLLMGLYSMLTSIGFFWDNHSVVTKYPEISDLVDFINTIANAPFVFLPVLLGFSATRKFGGNPFLGAALGMLLVHPSLSDGWNYAKTLMEGNIKYWNVFGLEIEKVGYQGTVIPTIISAWVLATLEKNFRKFIPSYLDNLITPMFSLFIAGFLAFTVIGPFGREAGSLISAGLAWLYDTLGFFGGNSITCRNHTNWRNIHLPDCSNVKYCTGRSLFRCSLSIKRCQNSWISCTFRYFCIIRYHRTRYVWHKFTLPPSIYCCDDWFWVS